MEQGANGQEQSLLDALGGDSTFDGRDCLQNGVRNPAWTKCLSKARAKEILKRSMKTLLNKQESRSLNYVLCSLPSC